MDAETMDVLETLEAVMREPQWVREFFFEPGQIQIVDNTRCGHTGARASSITRGNHASFILCIYGCATDAGAFTTAKRNTKEKKRAASLWGSALLFFCFSHL